MSRLGLGLSLALSFFVAACGGEEAAPPTAEDTTAPTLTITAPDFATRTVQNSVRVTGTVSDDQPGVRLVIGTQDVELAPDGSFDSEVRLEEGAQLIVIEATDAAGHSVSEIRTVVSGVMREPDVAVPNALFVALGPEALQAVASEYAGTFSAEELFASVSNPFFSKGGGCNRASAELTAFDYESMEGELVPTEEGLAGVLRLKGIVGSGRIEYRLVCLGGVQDITLSVEELELEVMVVVDPDAEGSAVQASDLDISFSGVNTDVGNSALNKFLSWGDDILINLVMDMLVEKGVENGFRNKISAFVEKEYTQTIGDRHYRYRVWPMEAEHSDDGLRVLLSSVVRSDSPSEVWLATPSAAPEAAVEMGENVAAVADDVVNQMMTAMWADGAFKLTLSEANLPLPAGADRLEVDLMLPPLAVAAADAPPSVLVSEAIVTARAGEDAVASITLYVDLAIEPAQGGLGLAVDVREQNVIRRTGEDGDAQLLEAGAQAAAILLTKRVNEAVAAIELPRLAGQELEPVVTGTDGYFLVTLPLAP